MSSGRIPSSAELRAFITQASRYIKHTRRLLKDYPEGRAHHGATSRRDDAIDGLKSVSSSGDFAAPYGWPEPICRALEESARIVDDLRSWYTPIDFVPSDRPPFDDQFNAPDEALVLSRMAELVAILDGAPADEPSYAPASDEEAEKPSNYPLTLDDRAVVLLRRGMKEQRPKMSLRKLAKELGCHHSSLRDCPTFMALWKMYPSDIKRGYRNAETGNVEADDSN
jgi:hypothetical protein